MNAKDYLLRAKRTKAKIRRLEEQANDLRLMMLPSAIRYDKENVQTSPRDKMPEYAAKIDELESRIAVLKARYFTEQTEIAECIDHIADERVQLVMILRYVRGMSYEEIARGSFLSIDRVYQIHRIGLKIVQELVKEE